MLFTQCVKQFCVSYLHEPKILWRSILKCITHLSIYIVHAYLCLRSSRRDWSLPTTADRDAWRCSDRSPWPSYSTPLQTPEIRRKHLYLMKLQLPGMQLRIFQNTWTFYLPSPPPTPKSALGAREIAVVNVYTWWKSRMI